MPPLFGPINLGAVPAPGRVAMAPLTRGRATWYGRGPEGYIDYPALAAQTLIASG